MFEEYIGKLVKVVYQDGDRIEVQKGDLISVENGFIKLQTEFRVYIIAVSQIIKVEVPNDETQS